MYGIKFSHAAPFCEILANVVSNTKTPFMISIELPDGQQTEKMVFEEPGAKNVILKGNNCASKHWQLNTFRRDENGQWQLAKESKAKLDGAGGQMTLKVEDALQPRVAGRLAVSCSESAICGGGPLSGNAGGDGLMTWG
ncbi:hypothetical protein niasHS_012543 [Heterodera schachtii]|uniref:Uncharacterized protein n=2 Tax=Heterodera TaxID=34509 RepID=A0ABD2IHP1_HETSC